MERRGFKLMGHPLHAPLTHFPMGLWMVSLAGDIFFVFKGDTFWWRFAFWNIALGMGIGSLTLLTGFLDYIFIPESKPTAEKTAVRHMTVMLTAALLFGTSLYFHRGQAPAELSQQMTGLILSGLGALCLALGGWLGGQLVYRHGIGYDDKP